MQDWFYTLADHLVGQLERGEILLLWLSAERSDFVRFNQGKVRQPGSVEQRHLTLRLIRAERQAATRCALTGDGGDTARLTQTLRELRATIALLPEDPHLLIASEVRSSANVRAGDLPPAEEITAQIVRASSGLDFVGFHAQGRLYRGFANSLGQRNWHEVENFNLEWSLYDSAGKATKSAYADLRWQEQQFMARLGNSRQQLALLSRPMREIVPGQYRVYLAPRALDEILGLLCWGGFSAKAQRTKRSPLLRAHMGDQLSAAVTLEEDIAAGFAPSFQADGFTKPARLTLIDCGRIDQTLASPRTAREYAFTHNGANEAERPVSLVMHPGDLANSDVLRALERGLFVSNLWYLNYSDRAAGRITGMTRYATFWVENGEIIAPVAAMRFDDSIFRILGSCLEALTRERELILDASTYDERSTSSALVPGALLSALALTL